VGQQRSGAEQGGAGVEETHAGVKDSEMFHLSVEAVCAVDFLEPGSAATQLLVTNQTHAVVFVLQNTQATQLTLTHYIYNIQQQQHPSLPKDTTG